MAHLLKHLMIIAFVCTALAANCVAETIVKVVLVGLPEPLPKGITQQVRVIDASTGEDLNVTKGKAKSKFKIAAQATPSLLVVNHFSRVKKLNRVGVPESGFTVSGSGTHNRMPGGIASLAIVNIVQHAPCYGPNSGVVIVEVDPRVETALQNEFQLCSSELADPATCVANNYVAPPSV